MTRHPQRPPTLPEWSTWAEQQAAAARRAERRQALLILAILVALAVCTAGAALWVG